MSPRPPFLLASLLLCSLLAVACSSSPPTPMPLAAPAESSVAAGPMVAPTIDRTPLAVSQSTPTALPSDGPTRPPATEGPPAGVSVADWNPPPYPAPLALRPLDHFYFQRPIASSEKTWLHPRYRYGNTHFGEEPTHTGVDIVADRGTPVLAVGEGEVVWTGYGLYRGIADETDPYGLSVAVRHDFGYENQPLFTVYGHLDSISVWWGQPVALGQEVGTVGDTGNTSGTHLHFEVRVGENRYFHSRNPELWVVPPEGWGVMVGRILDSVGRPLLEYPITIRNLETDRIHEAWTYAKDSIHPDENFDENVVISNLPAGPYEIQINFVGHAYRAQLYVYPGQTNLVIFEGRKGFTLEPSQ